MIDPPHTDDDGQNPVEKCDRPGYPDEASSIHVCRHGLDYAPADAGVDVVRPARRLSVVSTS